MYIHNIYIYTYRIAYPRISENFVPLFGHCLVDTSVRRAKNSWQTDWKTSGGMGKKDWHAVGAASVVPVLRISVRFLFLFIFVFQFETDRKSLVRKTILMFAVLRFWGRTFFFNLGRFLEINFIGRSASNSTHRSSCRLITIHRLCTIHFSYAGQCLTDMCEWDRL